MADTESDSNIITSGGLGQDENVNLAAKWVWIPLNYISMVLKACVFYCSFQEIFHQLQNYVFLFIKDINQTIDANPTESDIDWLIYRFQNLLKVLETG